MDKREKLDFSDPIYKTGDRFLVDEYAEGNNRIIELEIHNRKGKFVQVHINNGQHPIFSSWYNTEYGFPTYYLLEKLD